MERELRKKVRSDRSTVDGAREEFERDGERGDLMSAARREGRPRLSAVGVEGKSLTWSPKRSSLFFLSGKFLSEVLEASRLCHLGAWLPL